MRWVVALLAMMVWVMAAGAEPPPEPTRVAVLNFGPSSDWPDKVSDVVGESIRVVNWSSVATELKDEHVQAVVLRINAGQGDADEALAFRDYFERLKKDFRVVGWVESATWAGALAVLPIEELYFMPQGNFGAVTCGEEGLRQAEKPEEWITRAETAALWGKYEKKIVRAMQTTVPLSATVDQKTGVVAWLQDETGATVVNSSSHILTFAAAEAVKWKFGRAIASTEEQLAEAMGLKKVEWVGQATAARLDAAMRAASTAAADRLAAMALVPAVRVAVLDFGPRPEQAEVGDMLGVEVRVADWREAIPLLERDKAQVVVVRANCSRGRWSECERFIQLFQSEFKPRFRTVAWIDSATSYTAISLLPIEEVYFAPTGALGSCIEWYCNLGMRPPEASLEQQLAVGKSAAIMGKHPPEAVRSMQILIPVSATPDAATGGFKWSNDDKGEFVVNPANQILTFGAATAEKFKFSRGTATSKEQLVEQMGLVRVEWCGQDASKLIRDRMEEATESRRGLMSNIWQYEVAVRLATKADTAEAKATAQANARRLLDSLRVLAKKSPEVFQSAGTDAAWLQEQEMLLKSLEKP